MAVNKRKILEAARKNVQKGAKQKALKDYGTLLQLDPRDAKLRLEVGDTHRRWGDNEEAIGHYLKVADQYQKDGFDARAVAVFKQILNLDPKRYTAQVLLAEIYQRMGLEAEAIGALQTAADGFHKEGKRREALELLRRMAALDPTNTTSRLKVGELLQQEGLLTEAEQEFEAVARELERQESREQLTKVYERLLELKPRRADLLIRMARNCVVLREPERAAPLARQAAEIEPDEVAHWELLCDIYKTLEDPPALAEATRELARVHRVHGDEDTARRIMQRVPAAAGLSEEAPATGRDETEAEVLGDDDLLDDDEFLDTGDGDDAAAALAFDSSGADFSVGTPAPVPGELDSGSSASGSVSVFESQATPTSAPSGRPAASPSASAAAKAEPPVLLPTGEPEQLFAEASVYLRYGKTDHAIASLRAVLAQQPGHRAAMEKLGDAHSEKGAVADAVTMWAQAAEIARAQGDGAALDLLRDRIAALDPSLAATIGSLPTSASHAELTEPDLGITGIGADDLDVGDFDDADLEIDADLEVDADLDPLGADAVAAASFRDLDEFFDTALENDAASGGRAAAAGVPGDSTPSFAIGVDASPSDEVEVGVDDDIDFGVDDELDDLADLGSNATSASASASEIEITVDLAGGSNSSDALASDDAASAEVEELVEQADFYFAQGMLEEAEQVFESVLELAPNHPTALVRMGEIAAVRDEPADDSNADDSNDDDSNDETGALAGGETAELEISVDLDGAETETIEADAAVELDLAGPTESAASAAPVFAAPASSVDRIDESEATETVAASALNDLGGASPLAPDGSSDVLANAETQPVADVAPALDDEAADAGGLFDLAAELRDSFDADQESHARDSTTPSAGPGTEAEAFASLFSEFKKGVSATLEDGDFETRFDLGIAYREMGLFDDAIAEFGACVNSPERAVESLRMMGQCALELGRVQDAIAHLQQGLSVAHVTQPQRAGLLMDLARTYDAAGDTERARDALAQLRGVDASWPGSAELLGSLGSGGARRAPAGTHEAYESFDDLIAEAEAEDSVAATAGNAANEAVEAADDDDPDLPDDKPRKSKKRISFV